MSIYYLHGSDDLSYYPMKDAIQEGVLRKGFIRIVKKREVYRLADLFDRTIEVQPVQGTHYFLIEEHEERAYQEWVRTFFRMEATYLARVIVEN